MKKRDKIYDSPEYKQIKEHLPEILKELERDKGLSQYQIPEEWNGDFERIYQKECRKEHIKRRILAGACAAVILTISAVHIGTHLEFTSVAQADDIGKIHESEFEQGGYQYSLYGNVVEDESDAMTEDENEVYFNSDTLFDLNKELKETIKCPFFILNGVPDGYTLTEAVYGKLHRNISYRIQWESQYIYVSQQMQIDDVGNGSVNEETVVNTIDAFSLCTGLSSFYRHRDHIFKYLDLTSVGCMYSRCNIPCVIGSEIYHGQENALNRQFPVQSFLYCKNGLDQLLKSFHRQICGLQRYQHRIGRDQCIDCHHTKARHTVDQDIIVSASYRIDIFFHDHFSAHNISHRYFQGRKLNICRK